VWGKENFYSYNFNMKKLLIIFAVIILGLGLYGAYWYFTQPRISVESVNGQSITFKYANLPPGNMSGPPYGTRIALIDTNGGFFAVQWKPTRSGVATVTPLPGTPLGTLFLRVLNYDTGKILAESGTFELGAAGPPTASIDQETLTSSSATPTITGTSNSFNLGVIVESSGRRVYAEEADVVNGRWSATLTPPLTPGTYTVKIYDSEMNQIFTTGTLLVTAN